MATDEVQVFPFRFDPAYRAAALPFGVLPANTRVTVSDSSFRARFGPWRVVTPRANVVGAELTRSYSFVKTAGPPHVSLADRGLTFATNGEQGVCVHFAEPIRGVDPTGLLRHAALTVTVADCEALLALLGP